MLRLSLGLLGMVSLLAAGCGKSSPILGGGAGGPTVDVPVPKADIPSGTKLDLKTMFTTKPFPKEVVPLNVVNDPARLQGQVTARTLTAGLPVTIRDLDSPYMGIMRELEPGCRAMGLRLELENAGSGFLTPGARVDIISAIRDPKEPARSESRVFLQNVKVLAVDDLVEPPEQLAPLSAASKPVFVTLMVRPEQAERLFLEAKLGSLSLIIRKPGDVERVETRGASAADRLKIEE